jgi:hypothetical protein
MLKGFTHARLLWLPHRSARRQGVGDGIGRPKSAALWLRADLPVFGYARRYDRLGPPEEEEFEEES